MARPTRIAVVSTLFVIAPFTSRAQAPSSSTCAAQQPTLNLSAGLAQSDRVDQTASPVQFGGRGADFSATYERARGALCFSTTGRGGVKTLNPTNGIASKERLIDAELGVAALRTVGASANGKRAFALGAEMRGQLAVTSHYYTDPELSTSQFRFGVLSLGPAARWRESIRGGTAVVQLSSPLFSVVEHPYAAITDGRSGPRLDFTSVNALRGLQGSVSYEWAATRRMSILTRYQAGWMRYDDIRPVRSLTQSFSVGITTPLGGARR